MSRRRINFIQGAHVRTSNCSREHVHNVRSVHMSPSYIAEKLGTELHSCPTVSRLGRKPVGLQAS